ncbi:hypothetical protein [Streptomyces sp. Da 82-17]|uniref:hypothetical protein n=1 Tax=Streptomyces sp. Da 82-17 TaxID=3377116 RepID=UPI0038D4A55F
MTREELRETLGGLIHGHSRFDSTERDVDQAMKAVDAHLSYLAEQAQGQTSPVKGDQR